MSIPGEQPNPYTRPPQGPQPGAAPASPTEANPQSAPRPGMPTQGGVPTQGTGYGPGGAAGATTVPELTGQIPAPHAASPLGTPPTTGIGTPSGGPGTPGTPGTSGTSGNGRGRIPGWVWGIGGAVLASAVWGAATIVNGGFRSEPAEPSSVDLAGYHFHPDLCDVVDDSTFEEHYTPSDRDPATSRHSAQDAQDVSSCALQLKRKPGEDDDPDDGYTDYDRSYRPTTYVDLTAVWHKKSDPGGEFEAHIRGRQDLRAEHAETRYNLVDVGDLGDEAYFASEARKNGPMTKATLSVRDGWFEAEMVWSSYTARQGPAQLSESQVKDLLVKSVTATLAELKKQPSEGSTPAPGSSSGPDDSGPGGSEPGASEPPKRGDGDI